MNSTPDSVLTPEQQAWVDDYDGKRRDTSVATKVKQAAMVPLEHEVGPRPIAEILTGVVKTLRRE